MSENNQFSRYHELVSAAATQALAAVDNPQADSSRLLARSHNAQATSPASLNLAMPAAKFLLNHNYAGLADAMRTFADIGRPWLPVGIASGSLGANVDDEQTKAKRTSIETALGTFQTQEMPNCDILPKLTDAAGHARDIYHPLALHLCLAAFDQGYESLPPDVWSICEQSTIEAVGPCRLLEFYTNQAPPSALVPLVLWHALCLAQAAKILHRDVDLELVDSVVETIINQHDTSLQPFTPNDTIETWTYLELTGLHALANLALLRRSSAWSNRVEQIAIHHQNNTQPDNSTNQPWGVFAFLWSPKTRMFAEQQLHDCAAHTHTTGNRNSNLAIGLLLTDAANSLKLFT